MVLVYVVTYQILKTFNCIPYKGPKSFNQRYFECVISGKYINKAFTLSPSKTAGVFQVGRMGLLSPQSITTTVERNRELARCRPSIQKRADSALLGVCYAAMRRRKDVQAGFTCPRGRSSPSPVGSCFIIGASLAAL